MREILEEKKSNGLVNFLASLLSKSVENNEPVEVCSDVDLSKELWYENKNMKPEPNISAKFESQSCVGKKILIFPYSKQWEASYEM